MLIWNPPTNLRLYPQCFHWSEREVQGKQKGKGNVEPSSWLLAVWSAFPAQLDDVKLDANFISWKLNCKTEWFVKSRNLSQFYWWLLSITSKTLPQSSKCWSQKLLNIAKCDWDAFIWKISIWSWKAKDITLLHTFKIFVGPQHYDDLVSKSNAAIKGQSKHWIVK